MHKHTTTIHDLKKSIQNEYETNRKKLLKQRNAYYQQLKGNQKQQQHYENKSSLPSSSININPNEDEKSSVIIKKKILNQIDYNQMRKISWRHIWRTYILEFNGIRLENENTLLKDYGITHNNSILKFTKKYNAREM